MRMRMRMRMRMGMRMRMARPGTEEARRAVPSARPPSTVPAGPRAAAAAPVTAQDSGCQSESRRDRRGDSGHSGN
eukprot:759981-Hanusia_phi.AAC.1